MKFTLKSILSVIAITATLSLTIGFNQNWEHGNFQFNLSTGDLHFDSPIAK